MLDMLTCITILLSMPKLYKTSALTLSMMRTFSMGEVMVEILDLSYKLTSPLSCQPSKTVFLVAGNYLFY